MERRITVGWEDTASGLTPEEQHVAERIEFVFLTWDPFGWTEEVELDRVLLIAPGSDGRLAMMFAGAAVGRFVDPYPGREFTAYAEWVVQSVARREAVFDAGDMRAFLDEVAIEARQIPVDWQPGWSPPSVTTDSGWQPMTIETVTDYALAMTGFEPFDPTTIRLDPVDVPLETCPSCRGRRLRLPFEFDDARGDMCSPHRATANAHMARLVGPREDEEGWWLFSETVGRRFPQPHLPAPLRAELDHAFYGEASEVEQAETLVKLIDLAGDRSGLELFLDDVGWEDRDGEDPRYTFETTSQNVAFELGRQGNFVEAGRFIDRLTAVDPDGAAGRHAELAAQAARADRPQVARERIAAAIAAPGVENWPHLIVADAEAALGDTDAAVERLDRIREVARHDDDPQIEREALAQLRDVLRNLGDPAHAEDLEAAECDFEVLNQRLYPAATAEGSAVREVLPHEYGRKVGRNEPCPCGSGLKYKKCHGR
jgi:tetratricopeptide (TPR) repeat protein